MSIRTNQSSALAPRHTAVAAAPNVNPAVVSTPWVRNPSWAALPSVTNTEQKLVGLHAVYPDSNFLALSAATVQPSNKLATGSTTDAATFTTASVTLTAGKLYILTVENSHGTSASAVSSITGGSGVPTFTNRADTLFNSNLNRVTLLSAIPSSDYTGTLTINFGGTTQTGALWNLTEFQNPQSTTNDGIVQTVTATGNSTMPSATLSAFSSPLNSTFGAVANVASALTLGSGFAAYGNATVGTPTQYLGCEWRFDNATTVNGTITSGQWAIIAVELAAATAYTVDWGDGTTENINGGVQANHQYDFTDGDLANTNAPVTFQDTGDTVTRTAHGYTDGMTVSFSSITTTTGLSVGQIYYVVNATANTFQVSATSGGSAIALTNDGSGTILPYKQAIVTLTVPTGQSLTNINLNLKHTQAGLPAYASGWLDLVISGPNLTSLQIAGNTSTLNVAHRNLEQAQLISTNSIASMAYLFLYCTALRSIPIWQTSNTLLTNLTGIFEGCSSLNAAPLFNTGAVTNMSEMFYGCSSLQSVPLFNTASVINMSQMFYICYSLQSVPLFNTASVTNMSQMLYTCYSLQSVPLFNTASVTNMSQMLQACYSLKSVPLFNTASVTNMSNIVAQCSSLQSVPLFNTASVTNMANMMLLCSSLKSVPLFNTAAATNMISMFQSCTSLQSVPLFNTAAATNMISMFQSCTSLQSVPKFTTSAATNVQSMFQSCSDLQSVPALDFSAVTTGNFASTFATCPNLATLDATGYKFSFSVDGCKLSTTAVNAIFANLARVTAAQTLTLGSNTNWGAQTYSKASSGTTSGSTTVTMSNTGSLSVGMEISGTGVSDAVAVTFQDTGDTVTRTAHGIANNTPVSFATIVTTTGIATYTTYYVVNAATDTFQVSDTVGGAAKALTTDGSGTLLYGTTITAINTNVDVTLSIPASATGSVTLVAGVATRSVARLKGWTVSG